ncbi:MAG: hypothetical protein K2G04_05730, partial [Oscillospiraceae bacterium]|nr:hypothetical protein [Oscillospiraceae bacterium]
MKKKLALLTSALMILSLFSSCGDSGDTNSANADTSSGLETAVTESASEIIDFFDEDYDPFSDDYDPYGGVGASAVKQNPETNSVSENSMSEGLNEDIKVPENNSGNTTEAAVPAANN